MREARMVAAPPTPIADHTTVLSVLFNLPAPKTEDLPATLPICIGPDRAASDEV